MASSFHLFHLLVIMVNGTGAVIVYQLMTLTDPALWVTLETVAGRGSYSLCSLFCELNFENSGPCNAFRIANASCLIGSIASNSLIPSSNRSDSNAVFVANDRQRSKIFTCRKSPMLLGQRDKPQLCIYIASLIYTCTLYIPCFVTVMDKSYYCLFAKKNDSMW